MFYDADIDIFFTDFARVATFKHGLEEREIRVVFNTEYQVAVDINTFAGIESYRFMAEAKTSDVEDVQHGDTLTIGDKTYYIHEVQHTDIGTTRLLLSEVE